MELIKRLFFILMVMLVFGLDAGCGTSKPRTQRLSDGRPRCSSEPLPWRAMEYFTHRVRPHSDDHSGMSAYKDEFSQESIAIQISIILDPLLRVSKGDTVSLSFLKVGRLAHLIREFFSKVERSEEADMVRTTVFNTLQKYPLTLGSKRRLYNELEKPLPKRLPGLDTLCKELSQLIIYDELRTGILNIIIDDLENIEYKGSVSYKEKMLRKLNDGFLTLTGNGRRKMADFLNGALALYDIELVRDAVADVFAQERIYPLTAQAIVNAVVADNGEDVHLINEFQDILLHGVIAELQEDRDAIHQESCALTAASKMLCEEPLDAR